VNDSLGFNSWSCQILRLFVSFKFKSSLNIFGDSLQIDFLEKLESNQKWNAHATAVVRVTIKGGAYHEDVGTVCFYIFIF